MTKQSPDEFRVVARAPLTLPPDFRLRPPQPGAVRPQEGTPTEQARKVVFRADTSKILAPEPSAAPGDQSAGQALGQSPDQSPGQSTGQSPGERSFLKALGADKIDTDIRQLVNREADELRDDTTFLQALVFWRDPELPGEVVDAEGENRRLRENSALGKDITVGETPTIERREKALFEGIF